MGKDRDQTQQTSQELSLEYKPEKPGLEKVLGPLETEIMELVWAKGQVSVREVSEMLNAQNKKNLAYTTVMTIMSRLSEKNILRRIREGGAYIYEPVTSRVEFSRRMVGKVIDSLLDDFSEPAIAHFVGKIKDIDPIKLAMLEKMITERKNNN